MTNGDDAELPAEREGSSVPEDSGPSRTAPIAPTESHSVAQLPRQRAFPLTGAEQFWYILHCIYFGAAYFAKIPTKKALSEAGFGHRTGAEQFWYVLLCIYFGVGYFTKLPMKKAMSDLRLDRMTDAGQFWYVLMCLYFGAGYFAKVFHKKALSEMPILPQPRPSRP